MVVYTERQYDGYIWPKKFCLGDWVLSGTGVTPPIFPENLLSGRIIHMVLFSYI
jgi:hypothetical protein